MTNPGIADIHHNWDIDAKKENMQKYFFQISDLDQVLSGKKPIVVGRKGTGKTAMFQYIKTLHNHKTFISATSFTSFPVTSLLKFKDSRFESGSDYISLWTFVILKEICSLIASTEGAPALLRELFTPFSEDKMRNAFTADDGLSINLFKYFEYKRGGRQMKEESWLDQISAMKSTISGIKDNNLYYVLFDSLDDNFRDVALKLSDAAGERNYFSCIAGLIKATLDLSLFFNDVGLQVKPIVFLSSDVLEYIQDRDKNKWRYSTKYLDWDEDEIKQFISHRISVSTFGVKGSDKASYPSSWHLIFDPERINVNGNRVSSFDYITTRTLFRPRDYITYVKDCCEVAFRRNFEHIRPGVVVNTEGWYSEYFWKEFVDEIFPIVPPIDRIFKVIEKIRKPSFSFDDFDEALNRHVDMKFIKIDEISNLSTYLILTILYEYSVIGNLIRGERSFKYRRPTSSFDFEQPIVTHRGLDVVLGINPRAKKQRDTSPPRRTWKQDQTRFDFEKMDDTIEDQS